MSDYITRQDAIKFFTELWECIGTIGDREEWEDVCVTTVNEIKSAQPEQKWTPCSEGLPKVVDCYAVTEKIGSDLITSACFFDGISTWYNDNQINHERNYLTNIVAWMPLPEPYTEGEE